MLVKEALTWGILELEDFTSKQLESRILLASILKTTQEGLLIRYNEPISQEEEKAFYEHIKCRKALEPIAYIVGKKEFYGRDFIVNKHVLIPRPETELIIDRVILEYQKNFADKEVTILDLGTGSGAIAVTLATLIPQAKIVAIDISDEALALAAENAKLHGAITQIQFIKSDWYSNLSDKKFNFIISNPPYISPDNKIYMAQETILYEPEHALFAVENGLINYRKIIFGLNNFLKNENKVFLEIGFNQAEDVINILKKYPFTEIVISKDLSGHDRVIEFRFI
ncbi:MAG: peptide chain release factor N(5)-glutamine methyltransferase [Alphaproteobacteria bacterium]|jgi:release factor glutamine methyltransferase|nr:peptide chain release factor N(5)-glutamine methyltransferase [Alphaproteobacteria bacterium]